MANYAFLDDNSKVLNVIAGRDETEIIDGVGDWETYYGNLHGQRCVRTSFNAAINGFRKNYAVIGYTYDETRDAFIPPKPFESWLLDEETCLWEAPKPYPEDGAKYQWNEELVDWEAVDFTS